MPATEAFAAFEPTEGGAAGGDESTAVVDGLRRWSRGCYAEEAAVELVARAFGGRFAQPHWPWIQTCDRPGWWWLDGESLIHDSTALSGGEHRVLMVAGALVSGLAVAHLAEVMAGIDRPHLALVLAALAHAGGSHEQVDRRIEQGRMVFRRLSPLIDWPTPVIAGSS